MKPYDENNPCIPNCNDATQEDMKSGSQLRAYREKLGLSVEDFLFELRQCGNGKEFKFSLGHYSEVELEKRPITERLAKAIKTYRSKK